MNNGEYLELRIAYPTRARLFFISGLNKYYRLNRVEAGDYLPYRKEFPARGAAAAIMGCPTGTRFMRFGRFSMEGQPVASSQYATAPCTAFIVTRWKESRKALCPSAVGRHQSPRTRSQNDNDQPLLIYRPDQHADCYRALVSGHQSPALRPQALGTPRRGR
jgi:hypothetical protein